jgi:hypothetical protein
MPVDDAINAIHQADIWALVVTFAVAFGATLFVWIVRRRSLRGTAQRLIPNTLTALALAGILILSVASYELTSTALVARALRPMAVAGARYLGNPDHVSRDQARQRASAIVRNMPVDPFQFACNYPGWSVPGVAVFGMFAGVFLVRRRRERETTA